MTEPEAPSQPLRRVLVALDPAAECRAALEMAARLAAESHAELVGLFVEDRELLEAAALPVTRVIRTHDFVEESLDTRKMERGLRVWAHRAEARLNAAAARWHVRSSFRVVRGAIEEALLTEARSADLVALGTVGRPSQRRRLGHTARLVVRDAPCSVMVMRSETAPALPVAVLYEGADRALELAEALAQARGAALVILATGENEAAAEAMAAAARQWIEGRKRPARVETLVCADAEQAGEHLATRSVSVVLLERGGALGGAVDPESVLAGPAASVILTG